jgi:predicted PurR-regulated permease PerM
MTDRIIILVMFTGTWLLGAWGTFVAVKIRQAFSNGKSS